MADRDYTRYNFNGKTNLPKTRLVWEVIKKYVEDHPDLTVDRINEIFPQEIQGSMKIAEYVENIPEDKLHRLSKFNKDEESIHMNGKKIAIAAEWNFKNILRFIRKAEELGYEIVESESFFPETTDEYEPKDPKESDFPTADKFLFAFIQFFSKKNGHSENQKRILQFHLSQQNYSTTARIITENLGLTNIGHANMLCGHLAKGLCQILGKKNLRYFVEILFDFKKNDEFNNELQWILHPPVVEALKRFFSMSEEEKTKFIGNSEKNEPVKKMKGSNQPLNLILYGPPGTGKTYNTTAFAVRLIEGGNPFEVMTNLKNNELSDTEIERFSELRKSGQIEFITFHQSYSYEDFVEGIKPDVEKEEMKFKRVDGIFKNICAKADKCKNANPNKNIWKISLGEAGTKDYENVFNFCIKNSYIILGFRKDTDYTGKPNDEIQKIYENLPEKDINPNGYRSIQYIVNEVKTGDYIIVPAGLGKIRAIGIVTGNYEFDEKLRYYSQKRKVEWLWWTNKEEKMIVLEDHFFTMTTLYPLKDDRFEKAQKIIKETLSSQSFVLIIDEINRGNISRIFGELITLIEEDKRDGMLTVKLPYSQEDFTVPSNLFIIGTMNTADRSIALLDIALRRRFTFFRFDPRPELVEFKKAREIMEKLNEEIVKSKGKDFQIGHSYFMKVKDEKKLKAVIDFKIKPLLEEYFVNDPNKLKEFYEIIDR
ncbi:MAG TPA: AAA family ATPase [bacterium]|nr:AAA family ATPase [bacterium]